MRDQAAAHVSRETLEKLDLFEALIKKWNPVINLISKASLENLWTRHIIDSIQIFDAARINFRTWLDMGSGGGFPGVVIAILASDQMPDAKVTLMESDTRKAAFLRAALREVDVAGQVLAERIESAAPQNVDVVSARALADLSDLLAYADRHLSAQGMAIFAKGANWKKEVAVAETTWNFDVEAIKSNLQPDAAILKITGVTRV